MTHGKKVKVQIHGVYMKPTLMERVFDGANILLFVLLTLMFLYPFLNLAAISFSADGPVLRGEVTFFPKGFDLDAYDMVFENKILWRSFGNSVFVAGVGCAFSLLVMSVAAYPMAFCKFHGKKFYTFAILLTMWFNGGLIPTYMVVRELHLINSLWSLIVTSLLSAYYIIIIRSYFVSIPISLIESAKIDGANDFWVLLHVVLPLSKPVMATVALWVVVGHWNSYFYPLMFLTKMNLYTLQMVLKDIVLQASTAMYDMSAASGIDGGVAAISEQVRNAVLVVSMLPMLVLYPFLQKYFVSGVMLGAVKG